MKHGVLMAAAGVCVLAACGSPAATLSREEATDICSRVLREQFSTCDDVQEACLMLMEVRSGEVLASVDLVAGEDGGVRVDSPGEGWLRKFEPGPVFEAATLAALLGDGAVRSLEDQVPVGNGVVQGTDKGPSCQGHSSPLFRDGARIVESAPRNYFRSFLSSPGVSA